VILDPPPPPALSGLDVFDRAVVLAHLWGAIPIELVAALLHAHPDRVLDALDRAKALGIPPPCPR
jgi:hypothetical protein